MNEELKVIIKAELAQFKQSMKDAISNLKAVGKESKKASSETKQLSQAYGELGSQIQRQNKRVKELREQYADAVVKYGKTSTEATKLAKSLVKITTRLKDNKEAYEDAMKAADKYDMSVDKLDMSANSTDLDMSFGSEKASKNIDNTNESMSELQDTLNSIYTLNIWEVISKGFGDWSKKAKDYADDAKEDFHLVGTYFKQGWKELIRDPDMLAELDVLGEGLGDSIKGSLISAKEGFKTMGSAVATSFKAIGAAIAASAAIIIADLLVIIGLAKNALTVAKEVKQMSAEASKIGLETDTYQEWGYILKQVGIETDKLTDFLKTLTDEQNEVRAGSEDITEAFERIGLSAEEVMGSSQEELFAKTVEGLQNIENASERTSLAYKIFGEDAADLANVLYLTNQETQSLANNFYALGAAPSDNLINKSKILTGSTTNLSYAWQGLRNTLAEWVIPAVIAVVQWLTTAVAYINVFLQGIFGVKAQSKDASKGANQVGSSIGGIGSNAKKATAAVKELLRYTMGFDELNVIPKENSGNAGSGSGSDIGASGGYSGAGINPELPVIEVPDMTKFRKFMEEYGSLIQGLLTWGALLGGLAMVVAGCMSGNIPLIIGGASIIGLGIAIGAAGGEESHWNKLGESIKNAWNNIKSWFSENVKPIFTKEWWSEKWNKLLLATHEKLVEVLLAITGWWNGVKEWWNTHIAPVFTKDYWLTKWDNIKQATSDKMAEIKAKLDEKTAPIRDWFNTSIKPVFTKEYWKQKFDNIKQAASDKLTETKTKIDEKMAPIKNWFNTSIKPIFTKEYWRTKFDSIKQAASDKLAEIKYTFDAKIAPLKNWFNNKVKPIFTVSYWTQKWGTLKSGAKSAFNGIIDIVERAINRIISRINTLSWTIPDWVPKIGGDTWGFNFKAISIPRLATGGIATSSILANIGEAGREAVLPLDRNTEWMDRLADRINSRNNTPSRIVLMVGERELGYAAINGINNITQQTGQLQLALY